MLVITAVQEKRFLFPFIFKRFVVPIEQGVLRFKVANVMDNKYCIRYSRRDFCVSVCFQLGSIAVYTSGQKPRCFKFGLNVINFWKFWREMHSRATLDRPL